MKLFSKVVELMAPAILKAEKDFGPANVSAKHEAVLQEFCGEKDAAIPKGMEADVRNAIITLIGAGVQSLTKQKKLPDHTPQPA